MTYYYNGIERLRLCFANPNLCGAFLAVALFVCVWCVLELEASRNSRLSRFGECISAAFAILLEWLVTLTYSRGAILAVFAGLAFGFFLSKSRLFILFLLTLLICIFISNCGMRRMSSLARPFSDASIYHRIDFWKGAVGIMAEAPLSGRQDYVLAYNAWRLPLEYESNAGSMVSDLFTLGARYGCLAPFLYLCIFLSAFFLWMSAAGRNPECRNAIVGMSCCVMVYFVSGLFSTICFHAWYLTMAVTAVALALSFIGGRGLCKERPSYFKWLLACPAIVSLALVLFMLLWGVLENRKLCFTMEESRTFTRDGYTMNVHKAFPRRKKIGRVAIIRDIQPESLPRLDVVFIRSVMRPLLEEGYEVASIVCNNSKTAFGTASDCLDWGRGGGAQFLCFLEQEHCTLFCLGEHASFPAYDEAIGKLRASFGTDECIAVPEALKQFRPRNLHLD